MDVVAAINGFGHDLFLRRLTDLARNTMLSPLSLGLCTAMAASGSAGKTADEFEAALRLPSGSCAQLPEAAQALSQTLKGVVGLSVANALAFEGKTTGFRTKCIARMHGSFDGEVFTQATASGVNAWVEEKTHGMIPHLISIISSLVLINALYFKGVWCSPGKSEPAGPFVTSNGETITVARMSKAATPGPELSGAQTFLLPYKDTAVALLVILPESGRQAVQVAHDLPPDATRRVLDGAKNAIDVDYLHMPPFRVDAGADLVGTFKEAGLRTMFDELSANFSAIKAQKDPHLFVSQIAHRVAINVNHVVTEAAAATAMGLRFASGSRFGDERKVVVDRPFLFCLIDRSTGAVLIQGCIHDPR